MTPTQFEAVERSKRFRIHIAAKAAELKARNAPKPAPVAVTEETYQSLKSPVERWADRQKEIWFSIVSVHVGAAPTVETIQMVCRQHFGMTAAEFLADRRKADVVRARQVAMYLTKKYTSLSLPQIGKRFAGRDHTTVLHAVRKMERLIKTDALLALTISCLEEKLT